MKKFWDMPEYKFNGFNPNGDNTGGGEPDDEVEGDEEEHEHIYLNIVHSENITAYEELVHQVITLEFGDRGISLDLSVEEAEELGHVVAEIMRYLERKRAV
jgi:hypothetical protein